MGDAGEFQLVRSRRRNRCRVQPRQLVRNTCDPNRPLSDNDSDDDDDGDEDEDEDGNENNAVIDVNREPLYGKLAKAEIELKGSPFAENVFHSIERSLNDLNVDGPFTEILCYGLGSFSHRKSSMYQLALLLLLKDRYESPRVYIYDPVFSSKEMKLLTRFGFEILKTNEEGKRVIGENVTLAYMPHCAMHLINNFMYANWGRGLCNCILMTNSFSAANDSLIASKISSTIYTNYIVRVQPYVTEIALRNDFPHEEAFNDLSIHLFLKGRIDAAPSTFWTEREEPCYLDTIIDYFTAKQTERIDAKNRRRRRRRRRCRSPHHPTIV